MQFFHDINSEEQDDEAEEEEEPEHDGSQELVEDVLSGVSALPPPLSGSALAASAAKAGPPTVPKASAVAAIEGCEPSSQWIPLSRWDCSPFSK